MENLSKKVKEKMDKGDYKGALLLCLQALETEPDNIDFLEMARNASFKSGDYDSAKDFSKMLIIAEPLNPDNYYDLGCMELNIFYDFDEAILNLKKTYELDSDNKEALYKTGLAYRLKGDYETAKQYYEQLLNETSEKNLLGHTYIELAHISCIEGDYPYLFRYLNKAENVCPELPDTYIYRAITLKEKLFSYEKALKQLRKALKITKKDSYVYYLFADIYYLEQNFKKALKYIEKAIKLKPDDGEYRFLCALIRTELCMFIGDVLSELTYAVLLSENNDRFRAYRSEVFIVTKEYEKALDDINRAIEIRPEKASYYKTRGDIYKGMKKFYDASLEYLKSIQLNKPESEGMSDEELQKLYQKCLEKLGTDKQEVVSALAGMKVSEN
jgi:tetratricopeptide (TPR) repeat protein